MQALNLPGIRTARLPDCWLLFWSAVLSIQSYGDTGKRTVNKKQKGKGNYLNVGGQTGKDCLLTWADGVKVADRRDRTRNLSLSRKAPH